MGYILQRQVRGNSISQALIRRKVSEVWGMNVPVLQKFGTQRHSYYVFMIQICQNGP